MNTLLNINPGPEDNNDFDAVQHAAEFSCSEYLAAQLARGLKMSGAFFLNNLDDEED
jgi:hypothetical protein